ncbi:MAG TPA: S8 family serine peptidase [Actinomycetes bacterium]|nr:S8 family serine peptidase [Actinomycetes bacterium]
MIRVVRAARRTSAPAGVLAVAAAVLISSSVTFAASAAPRPAVIHGDGSRAAIPGSYVVRLKATASLRSQGVGARARALADAHGGTVRAVWQHALHGFAATMTRDQALRLAADPDVESVMQDQRMTGGAMTRTKKLAAAGSQTPVTWGLDRIDQHALPLDNHYAYDESAGQGVHAYILSTGIQASHPDFGGRVSGGGNFINDGRPSTSDCQGHGTRLAGIVGGTQFGVAKQASLVSVRMADCNNTFAFSTAVSAFDWTIAHAVRPAVLLFTMLDYCIDQQTGDPVECEPDVADTMVNAQESAFVAGLPVFGMAGDLGQDACAKATGAAPDTVYVGSTASNDSRGPASNFGPCITMFAPGEGVTTDDPFTGTDVFDGSPLASAYVAGAAALFAGKPEFAGASPAQIRDELVQHRSTPGVVTGVTGTTPNRLLFTGPPGFYTTGESASLAPSGDGRLNLFGATRSGALVHREQTAAGSGSWSPWTQSVTTGWLTVGADTNADGRLALLGVTTSGELWVRQEVAANSNSWSTWSRLTATPGSVSVGRAVMAHNKSNRMEIFATDQQGRAFYRSQLSPGSQLWSAWTPFSFAGKLRSISAVGYADGRIEVLGVDDAGQVWRTTQTSPTDNNWSPFTRLGGFGMAVVAAARNADGRLELAGLDAGGGVWHRAQTTVGTWGNWSALNPRTLSRLTAETEADGRIHLVGVDNLGKIWQSTQTSANAATWSSWSQLDGQLRP